MIPASYTEESLAAFMVGCIGRLAGVLGMDASHFMEAINDTLLDYGVNAVEDATDIKKLRALARYHAWRTAVAWASGLYDFQADDGRFSKAQVHQQALSGLALAESDALAMGLSLSGSGYQVTVGKLVLASNPYATDEE